MSVKIKHQRIQALQIDGQKRILASNTNQNKKVIDSASFSACDAILTSLTVEKTITRVYVIMWIQKQISLTRKNRGFHLITDEIYQVLPELQHLSIGLAHLLLQHTSAGLTLNENADPSVREDFERYFNQLAPENEPYYTHTYEGPDDMPAHLKSSLLGAELTIPITDGEFNLGTWQGIYLCEARDRASERTVIVTIQGQ